MHVVFSYNKETCGEQLPIIIPLNLSITPQVADIEQLTVKVDNADDFSWLGKVTHKFNSLDMTPQRLQFQALIDEVGVYDLNQLKISVVVSGKPQEIKLKDEMVIEVKLKD